MDGLYMLYSIILLISKQQMPACSKFYNNGVPHVMLTWHMTHETKFCRQLTHSADILCHVACLYVSL